MAFTLTPNMNIPLPNPAGSTNPEPGPEYAADQNQGFTIVDGHTHVPGSGVQITPAGLNINTNLSFGNNSATNVYGLLFSSPASSSTNTFLYTNTQSGGGIIDLFYNDGAGNVIALTKAGAVNATIASLPGQSYAGGTFTWKQGAGSTTPANFDIGSITIRPNVAATTNGVVLGPPSAISSQYNVQLPIVPASVTSIMQLNTSGDMIASLVPDNSTIVISSQILQVGTIQPSNLPPGFGFVPSGAIISYGGTSAPAGYLMCDGVSYLISDQPDLAAALFDSGTGNYAYGAADGTHFNVPDMRGYFPRGVDGSSGHDPDASSRTALNTGGNIGDNVGSYQTDQNLSHTHTDAGHTHSVTLHTSAAIGSVEIGFDNNVGSATNVNVNSGAANIQASGGNQSNPKNVYVNFIIKT